MRTFFVESASQYGRYHFPYTQWAEIEIGEDLSTVYGDGYLPASGLLTETRLLFYRARSLRLDLTTLRLDKKRRYLQRRGTQVGLTLRLVTKEAFEADAIPSWKSTVLQWIAARHSTPFMDQARLEFIFSRPFLRHVALVHHDDSWVGLVLLPQGARCTHFWFSFYNSEYMPGLSLGKWILGETAARMHTLGHDQLYLGTAYGKKSRYKFQGMPTGPEFFDGNAWNRNLDELLRRMSADPD